MSEVRFDCQGLGLVARNEASILVFDTKPVLYRPVLDLIQFCSFDRGCKTCLDTKPVLDQGRFCSLTGVRCTSMRGRLWRNPIYATIFIKYFLAQPVNFKSEMYDETRVLIYVHDKSVTF